MTYTVWHKRKGLFSLWHKIKRVTGDYSFYVEAKGLTIVHPVRIIEQEDWTRYEFPMNGYRFKFSKERHIITDKKIQQETGK